MTSLAVKKNFLSELLPYDTSTKINGGLKTGLKEYSLLLAATKQAMTLLRCGDLEQFDAVVGENACQIRAVKIAMMIPKYLSSAEILLPPCFFQEEYQIPPFFNVANAYGAALSEISGIVDTIVSLQNREEVLSRLYEQAKQKAIDKGAKRETLRLVDQQIIPYSYVPNQMARVIVRYCGKRTQNNS